MKTNRFFLITFFVCFLFKLQLFATLPFLAAGQIPDVDSVTGEVATTFIILDVYKPDADDYKTLSNDQKISVEEFNVLAYLSKKSSIPMTKIWKWRCMKLSWTNIIQKLNLDLDDVIPKAEKMCEEPYKLCYTYWREKGNPKKVFSLGDYDFEKICEVVTLSAYSGKPVDVTIESLKKESFRNLSVKFFKEKNKSKRGIRK